MTHMSIVRFATVLLAALWLSACGWQLRGYTQAARSAQLPAALDLIAEGTFSPMAQAMRQAMHERNITETGDTEVQLHLGREVLKKRTVAVTAIGSASQYELTLAVPFHYRRRGQTSEGLPVTVSTHRVFDFDPQSTIAKTEEEKALLNEMRNELAHRILQHYASESPTANDQAHARQGDAQGDVNDAARASKGDHHGQTQP